MGVLAVDALGCFFALMALRGYFSSVEVLEKKLGSASFDRVKCHCYEFQHLSETGQHLLCDREVLKQCVTIWFGSTAAFEEAVRSELRDIVATELRQEIFTRGWALRVGSPSLWVCNGPHCHTSKNCTVRCCLRGLCYWFGCVVGVRAHLGWAVHLSDSKVLPPVPGGELWQL